MEEEFDLSAFKVVDENGEAQPVDIPQAESPEETPETEEVKEETEVENTSEEQTEVEETPVAETEVEEPAEEAEKEIGKPDELFSQLDAISKDLSNGKAENLEDFFDEYKRMRDSSSAEFKDDFIKNAVEYYNETGNLTPYLEATSVNYSEMSDEKVMRRDLEQANPTLSKGAIERLYTREIVDKYSLDEDKFDEDEVELGKELLAADATKLRDKYVDEQKNFTQPVKEQLKL